MPKQTFQVTKSLIKQPTVQLFQTNPTMQYSDNSFNVKPPKMLSDCGARGLRPDPPSPTGVNLLPECACVYEFQTAGHLVFQKY